MAKFIVVNLLIIVQICCYNWYPPISTVNTNPCGANGVQCYNYGYGCCCCPPQKQPPQPVQPPIIQKCTQTEWICPKDPRKSSSNVPIAPPAGIYVIFCDYDEQCPDIDNKPHKCCFDSATNTKICKQAIQRTL